MKMWMGALGRTLAIFVLSLVILAAGMALARGTDSSLPFLRTMFCCAENIYPLAAALAVFLGFFIFSGKTGALLSWVSMFCTGCFLMAACWALVWFFPAGGLPPARALEPRAGVAIEAGGLVSYVDSYSGDRALRAAGYDYNAPGQPRMSYAPSTAIPGNDGILKIEGRSFPTRAAQTRLSAERRYPLLEEAVRNGLGARGAAFSSADWREALFAALGFILLAAGLASLAGLPSWPLAGFFLACGGFFILLFLDQILADPAAGGLLRPLMARIGIGAWPLVRVQAAIEAALGLIAGIAGICAGTKRMEKQNGQQ